MYFLKRRINILGAIIATNAVIAMGAEGDVKSFPVGPFELTPLLNFSESYNDNIFWNNINRKGSMVTQIQPGFQIALERQLNRYALNYVFHSTQFHSSPHDNFVDHYVGGQTHLEFSSRHRLDMDARFMYGHNQRGTSFSQGAATITQIRYPDEFIQNTFFTRYRYGAEGAPGNLELLFNLRDLTFQNHRQRTAQWDRTEIVITPGFYYRVMPKTYLTTQVEATIQDYRNDLTTTPTGVPSTVKDLSYDKQRYLVGVTWNPTVKTSAMARLGYLQQHFSSNELPDINDFTWDVGVQWLPREYTRFSLESTRNILPTFGYGYVRKIDNVQLGWTHDWTTRVSSRIYGTYQHSQNEGTTRSDDSYGARVDLSYRMRPWLGLGFSYTYLSQASTLTQLDYDQNIVMLYLSGNPFTAQNSGSPWQLWYGN